MSEPSLRYAYAHLCSQEGTQELSKDYIIKQFGRIMEDFKVFEGELESFLSSKQNLSEEAFVTFCLENLPCCCLTGNDENIDLERICWRVVLGRESGSCSERQREAQHCEMDEEVQFNLWRLFVRLSKGELTLSREQSFWLSKHFSDSDLLSRIHARDIHDHSIIGAAQTFEQVASLASGPLTCLTSEGQQECLHQLQSLIDEVSERILKQGYLTKRGHVRHNWLKRWVVLYPTEFRYYSSLSKDELLGVCHISHQSRLRHIGGESSHDHRFMLTCGVTGKQFELSASSESEKSKWIHYLSFCTQHLSTTLEHACSKYQVQGEMYEMLDATAERSCAVLSIADLTHSTHLRHSCRVQILKDLLMYCFPATNSQVGLSKKLPP